MELEDFFQSNDIQQILIYKTKVVLNSSNPLSQRMLDYITEQMDGKIILLKSECISHVEFEDVMELKYKDIDHFVFSQPLIAVIFKDKKIKRVDDWCVFELKDRKYFYKFDDSIECQVYSDENGRYMKTQDGIRMNIISSVKPIKAFEKESKEDILNRMIENNSYYRKEINDVMKKIANIANYNINYDSKSKQTILKYSKNKSDIINYLNKINELLNNI